MSRTHELETSREQVLASLRKGVAVDAPSE
jgi:hypothetical protein